jgi:hypothetical protein
MVEYSIAGRWFYCGFSRERLYFGGSTVLQLKARILKRNYFAYYPFDYEYTQGQGLYSPGSVPFSLKSSQDSSITCTTIIKLKGGLQRQKSRARFTSRRPVIECIGQFPQIRFLQPSRVGGPCTEYCLRICKLSILHSRLL